MKIRILSCAEAEIAAAMGYYNKQSPGLGYDLAAETRECLRRIAAYPRSGSGETRLNHCISLIP